MKFIAEFNVKYLILGLFLVIIPVFCFFVIRNVRGSSNTYSSTPSVDENPETETDFEGIETTPSLTEGITITNEKSEKDALIKTKEAKNPDDTLNNFNILILGIDRRYGEQTHWRTDVIQLLTLNPKRDKAVVTHIPRDVWTDSYKINALYSLKGPDSIKDAVENITGQRPDRIIRVDFDAFVWLIDSMGGLTINVPNGFTDQSYPNDRKGINEPVTVTIEKGEQTMDGETALIYARSRKGDNGEGSDYARGKRQQFIMTSLIDDFFKPDNLFTPKTAETLYNIATKKVYTDMTIADSKTLFKILENYKNISVKNLGLDTTNFLIVPNSGEYGGQWVLIGKNNDYKPIHDEINKLLKE